MGRNWVIGMDRAEKEELNREGQWKEEES